MKTEMVVGRREGPCPFKAPCLVTLDPIPMHLHEHAFGEETVNHRLTICAESASKKNPASMSRAVRGNDQREQTEEKRTRNGGGEREGGGRERGRLGWFAGRTTCSGSSTQLLEFLETVSVNISSK